MEREKIKCRFTDLASRFEQAINEISYDKLDISEELKEQVKCFICLELFYVEMCDEVPYFYIGLFEIVVWRVIRLCSFGLLSSNHADLGYQSSCYHFVPLFINCPSINVVSLCERC